MEFLNYFELIVFFGVVFCSFFLGLGDRYLNVIFWSKVGLNFYNLKYKDLFCFWDREIRKYLDFIC